MSARTRVLGIAAAVGRIVARIAVVAAALCLTGLLLAYAETFIDPPSVWLWQNVGWLSVGALASVLLSALACKLRGADVVRARGVKTFAPGVLAVALFVTQVVLGWTILDRPRGGTPAGEPGAHYFHRRGRDVRHVTDDEYRHELKLQARGRACVFVLAAGISLSVAIHAATAPGRPAPGPITSDRGSAPPGSS
jgi:hypothetical protein